MKPGVNLIGYSRAEFGLGEACRSAAKALQSARIPFCIMNFPHCPARQNDLSWKHKEVQEPIYNTNIFFINADQLYYHFKKNNLPRKWFLNRYNIGYWHWELEKLPSSWLKSFQLINEVWVPSSFTAKSIPKIARKPVITIPHSISLEVPLNITRKDFELPESRFLFFSMFDMRSTLARKNPIAVVEAFKKAFSHNNNSVALAIKINNGSHSIKEVKALKQKSDGNKNIIFIDKVLNRLEVNGLPNLSDCYVSLHRSEGFGLPLAEAMYLGKPVIATNWSGNLEFMDKNNSCLVDFTLKRVGRNYGPYTANQLWAEPSMVQASQMMEKLVYDKKFAEKIGLLGKKTIGTKLSYEAIGEKYRLRLNQIGLLPSKK
ncbi:glycosyltransferase family 4 protein [Cytobacillus sp. NCCP-133]|uniref:glycosyltransferase family 4 protein n=1 Tax=Cytobacillus sp. NCCP-133 TaxID=766848 RepID=UPI002231E5B0|nr:glycosyltransferase [Cytobacillus sp. NCCP-133]GLB61959.1 glycosyl transferase [Cytobacillus sp. NCCP-133]